MSQQKICILTDIVADDEFSVPSTLSQQAIEQIEVIQVVVSPGVSKRNRSKMNSPRITQQYQTGWIDHVVK